MLNALSRISRYAITGLIIMAAWAVQTDSARAGWGHRWGPHSWGPYHGVTYHYSSWGRGFSWGHAWGVPSWRYTSLYVGVPRYRVYPVYSVRYYSPVVTYYPPVYYPTPTYYLPTYVAPVVYPAVHVDPCLTYVDPGVHSGSNVISDPGLPTYSTGLSPAAPRTSTPLLAKAPNATSNALASSQPLSLLVGKTSPSGSVVNRDAQPIPTALLSTADQMFANGGYRQAAEAYAQLSVRCGDHDELVVRRFIALVASGDHNQAAVVYELAQAKDQSLRSASLPAGSLTAMYGSLAGNQAVHVEGLARFAMDSQDDPIALAMVGTWLQLDNQPARAEPFIKRAAQLTVESERRTDPPQPTATLAWLIGK